MSCYEYVSEGPGPGAYNIPSSFTSARSSSRSQSAGARSKRVSESSATISAVAQNMSRLHKRVPTKLGASNYQTDVTPGPGAYNSTGLELKSHGPSFSIGPSRSLSQSGMRQTSRSNSRSASRSTALSAVSYSLLGTRATNRSGIAQDTATAGEVPGPGMYDVNISYVTSSSPSYSFGIRSKTPKQGPVTPGPGAYNPRPQSSGPSFSLSGRSPVRKPRTESPGPGAYNPQLKNTGPSFSMGGTRSPVRIPQADIPGPGAYDYKLRNNGPAFTMRSRSPVKQYVV
ncbi:Hypothetical protein DHA2_10522 [Giardia duodenalis]|uniref:SHIPPO repeat domain-containing protein n=1 Tax=Giardia intestinalis TaxID=5741 RepID=V6TJC8_GIAIN|nr:Hypothetical protein DHA2_10522 [Giardia intestinalis]